MLKADTGDPAMAASERQAQRSCEVTQEHGGNERLRTF